MAQMRGPGRAALAGGAGRDGDDGSVRARDHAAEGEGAAGGVGGRGRRGDERAVPAQGDLPGDAVAVLVDLELDLDAAVLAAQLELGGRALGADAAHPDAVAALGGRERSDGEGCGADGEGGGEGDDAER